LKTDLQATIKTTDRTKTRFAPRSLALCLAVTLFPFSPQPLSRQARAQSSANSTKQRVVDGRVDDKAGAAVSDAIVYLKDTKTLAVKSFICPGDGKFHFGGLSQNSDYELWAELNGKHSKTKHISSFSNQNNFTFSLVIE
jgi:hypothetical protein